MFQNIVPVTKEAHLNTKVKNLNSFEFVANFHIASIMMHEFPKAAAFYPIVFIEDKKNNAFKPVVLLGLQTNENLFVNEEGKWVVSYIPAIIRRYPFALSKTDEDNRFTICIDDKSEAVNEKEGRSLFKDDGEPDELLEHVKKYLGELQHMELVTNQLCKTLKEKYMFTPWNMRIREKNNFKNIAGVYIINEERLNNLSDEEFLSLRHQNILSSVYSHLNSLAQIHRLTQLRDNKKKPEPDEKKEAIIKAEP